MKQKNISRRAVLSLLFSALAIISFFAVYEIYGIYNEIAYPSNYSGGTGITANPNNEFYSIGINPIIQSKFFIVIALVFLALVIFYFIKMFLAPEIKYSRLVSGKRNLPAVESLLFEFEIAKNHGNKSDVKKIISRTKSLYHTLNDSQKNLIKSRFNEMEKYT